jgi:hypothetical protein
MPSDSSEDVMKALVERWFELDPKAAKVWVRGQHDQYEYFEGWARANPESALSEGLAAKDLWASTLASAALNAMSGDVAEKLKKAREIPPGELRDSVLGGMIATLAKQNPAAALEALADISSTGARESTREAVLRQWAKQDPEGALAKMDEIIPTLKAGAFGSPLVTQIAEQVAAKDPLLVLEWLKGIPKEFGTFPSIAAARQWAEKEPIPALNWCLKNGVDPARVRAEGVNQWQGGVLAEAMTRAARETIELVEALPPGPERQRLLECTFKESLWHTPLDQLFDGENPLALRLFNQLPPDAQAASAEHFGQKRGEKGLTDLNAWANIFQPGSGRTDAIASAVQASFQRDAAQVDELVATATLGADRDAALRGLAQAMSYGQPKAAAVRAMQISDPSTRLGTLDSVVSNWLNSDPISTRAWLSEVSIVPAGWRNKWLQRVSEKIPASSN